MSRLKQIIGKHGGTGKVASRIGKAPSAVSSWIKRGHIPVTNWQALIDIGFSREELLDAHLESSESENAAA